MSGEPEGRDAPPPEQIIEINESGHVLKSTVLREPEFEGPDLRPVTIQCPHCERPFEWVPAELFTRDYLAFVRRGYVLARGSSQAGSAPAGDVLHAEGERIFDGVCGWMGLDPNDGDVDSADAVDWIVAALKAKAGRDADVRGAGSAGSPEPPSQREATYAEFRESIRAIAKEHRQSPHELDALAFAGTLLDAAWRACLGAASPSSGEPR